MLDTPLDAVVGRDDEDVFGLTRSRPAGHTPSNPGWRSRLFVLAVMTFVAAAPGQAQETGTVRGTMTLAENGGPVDGAVILILGTGAFTFTENGAFEFTNVPVGSYLVTAQRERLTAGSQTVAVNAGETTAGDRAFASGSFTFEDSRFGLPFEDRFHAHGQDAHAEEDDHGDEEAGQAEDIKIDLASQRRVGRFDVGLRNLDNEFIQGVRAAFTAIDVADDHVDTIGGVDNIDTRFNNRTYITRALVYQRQREHVSGRFGAEMQIRDFLATGTEALAPRTDQTTFAAFGYEELRFGRYSLQLGGRLERNDYMTAGRVGAPGHDEEDHHDEPEDDHDHGHGHDDDDDDHEGEEEEHPLEPPDPRDRQFLGASASVGLHADLGADSAFVASVMHAHRVPALQELYNYGPHLGNFEVGVHRLQPRERAPSEPHVLHQGPRPGDGPRRQGELLVAVLLVSFSA